MSSGKYRLSKIEVERQDGIYKISWEASTQMESVTIYAGERPDRIDHSNPLAKVSGASSAVISGLDPQVRHYFEVVPDGGRGVIAAQRRVNLKGSINFRDLGGYETRDGRRIKWGHIYRSDSLA
ncbi:MAG: tyrosine-protein phosphatase, partial [Deltaproteobacteria bacterium]|nr:tyrosine-protein phosphatase [Deltaproteobacteria bacterium]